MEKFKEKLKALGVLDKFEANLDNWKRTHVPDEDEAYEAYEWPDISTVQKDSNKLMSAFDWAETPEGSVFWIEVYSKLYEAENARAMAEFEEKLAELGVLDKFEANFEKSKEVHGFSADFIAKYMSSKADNPSKLLSAFKWNDTPEGFMFWLDVYKKLHD